jgi:2-succinyl-6-hydroxy-2,4-cyclohexadiene-1-carboxylate synthase
LRRDADERLADRLEREPFDQWLQNWYRQPVFASLALRPGGVEEMVRRRLAGNPARLAQVLRRCSPGRIAPVWKALPRLPCPVLYIAGADDRTYVRIGRRVVQAVGRAMIREIPGAGHPVHVERPDIVAAAMREFIGKLPARRARKEIV